jgi:16S rRNA (adenine1518-N6/adenine1519-N6)-dimethyltransferase
MGVRGARAGRPAPRTPMWTQTTLRQALEARGLRPRKSLGQHFLVDPNFSRCILREAALPPGADVLEIGAGPGLLTAHLAPAARRVRAVEIDPAMAALCREAVDGFSNVEMIVRDILDPVGRMAPFAEGEAPVRSPAPSGSRVSRDAPTPLHVFGNLPYNRSVDILVALLAWEHPVAQGVVLVQREVGDRLRARAGTELYGPLSVVAQAFSRVEVLRRVPRGVFWPMPRVESVLVRLVPEAGQAGRVRPAWDLLKKLFLQRRKRLGNALRGIGLEAEEIRQACDRAGISPEIRAESLDPGDLLRLLCPVS